MRNLRLAVHLIALLLISVPFRLPQALAQSQPMGVVLNCWTGTAWTPCQLNPSTPTGVVQVAPYPFTPLTPGQYTPVSDAAATALTIPSGATYAVICAEAASHRFTWDGTTTPTAAIGTVLAQGSCVQMSGASSLAAFRIITVTGGGTFTASYAK